MLQTHVNFSASPPGQMSLEGKLLVITLVPLSHPILHISLKYPCTLASGTKSQECPTTWFRSI